jgi:hypothetical protein
MLPAVVFMVVALASSVVLWRMVAEKQQPEPVRIPIEDEKLPSEH